MAVPVLDLGAGPGATFVPLDVTHPQARQAELARIAGITVVVGERGWSERLAAAAGVQAVPIDDHGRPPHAVPAVAAVLAPARRPQDHAYVMFTSGSTGRPKGVRVPDSAVVARVASYRQLLADRGVRYLLHSPLTFDASVYLFWALATGGCLVLVEDAAAADPLALARLVHKHRITDTFFVPSLYEAVLQVAGHGRLDTLERVCVGGEVVSPNVAARHLALLPGTQLLDVYGPTEVVTTSTSALIGPAEVDGGRRLPIGRPHPGTLAWVLDRHGRRVPAGTVGQLHLGGPCVADGYDGANHSAAEQDALSRERTAAGQVFSSRVDEHGRVVRWYATGDLVRWRPDGQLDYLGRGDRQVKIRGQRLELGEVEAALRSVPGVRDAAVEVLGEGDRRRLVAFVAPEVSDVRRSVAAVLSAAAVPDVVVTCAELPRSTSGKLDLAALRRDHAE